MDNEDICFSSLVARYVKEVNVVLSQCHHRIVTGGVGCLANVNPSKGCRVGRSHLSEVKEVKLAIGQSIEDVGVVVEDGFVAGGVEGGGAGGRGGGDGLRGPGLGAGVDGCVHQETGGG